MLAARAEQARSASVVLAFDALITLTGALSTAGQAAAPGTPCPQRFPPTLPKTCLEQSHPSEKIAALLESVHAHANAGAYNTLGSYTPKESRSLCHQGLRNASVGDPNWEAHYNLAIALLSKGDRTKPSVS